MTLAVCVLFAANYVDVTSCVDYSKCILDELEMNSILPGGETINLTRYLHLLHNDHAMMDYLPCKGINNFRDVAELKIHNRLSSLWIKVTDCRRISDNRFITIN